MQYVFRLLTDALHASCCLHALLVLATDSPQLPGLVTVGIGTHPCQCAGELACMQTLAPAGFAAALAVMTRPPGQVTLAGAW